MLGNFVKFFCPSKTSYYFTFIIIIFQIILLIKLIIITLKKYWGKPNQHLNLFLDRKSLDDPEFALEIKYQKEILKSRYLIAFTLTRSAIWAKVPYLYALFMIVHKFSFP